MVSVSLGPVLPLVLPPLVPLPLAALVAALPHAVRERAATATAPAPMRLMVETVIEASRGFRAGHFHPACREGSVARLTSVRNDAIEWNAIVLIASTVRRSSRSQGRCRMTVAGG